MWTNSLFYPLDDDFFEAAMDFPIDDDDNPHIPMTRYYDMGQRFMTVKGGVPGWYDIWALNPRADDFYQRLIKIADQGGDSILAAELADFKWDKLIFDYVQVPSDFGKKYVFLSDAGAGRPAASVLPPRASWRRGWRDNYSRLGDMVADFVLPPQVLSVVWKRGVRKYLRPDDIIRVTYGQGEKEAFITMTVY